MTEKDIVRLAEEAELWLHTDRKYEAVEKFAKLVAAYLRPSSNSCICIHGKHCWGFNR